MCPVCDHRVKIPRDAIRPKLEELAAWQAEIPSLPFRPTEEETLNSIVTVGQNFRNYITPFMNNPMIATLEEVPSLRFYLRKIEGADILLADETNFFRQELYRFNPVAPEPPPMIDFSASTRKPRPTKQQKLMKEHGVDRPEDLPPELRTKQYGNRKRMMSQQEKDERVARGERVSNTPQLQFRPPLTATAFPRKKTHESRESPLPASSSNPYTTPASASSHLPPVGGGSPLAFDSATAAASPDPPSHNSTVDPTLFAGDMGFESQVGDEHPDSPGLTGPPNVFEAQADSSQTSNAQFDSMFADLTNQDDTREGESNLDPALFGSIS